MHILLLNYERSELIMQLITFFEQNLTFMFDVLLSLINVGIQNLQDCLTSLFVALETEGLFRRSASVQLVKELQSKYNQGQPVDFHGDVHLAAVLLKTFLRELEEPLMTFDLYDEITQFQSKLLVHSSFLYTSA